MYPQISQSSLGITWYLNYSFSPSPSPGCPWNIGLKLTCLCPPWKPSIMNSTYAPGTGVRFSRSLQSSVCHSNAEFPTEMGLMGSFSALCYGVSPGLRSSAFVSNFFFFFYWIWIVLAALPLCCLSRPTIPSIFLWSLRTLAPTKPPSFSPIIIQISCEYQWSKQIQCEMVKDKGHWANIFINDMGPCTVNPEEPCYKFIHNGNGFGQHLDAKYLWKIYYLCFWIENILLFM